MLVYLAAICGREEKWKFERIYLAYRGLMFHVAHRILHNEQDAEDAVHQSFVKIAESIGMIREAECPGTRALFVTIAERKAIDAYRARQRHLSVELDETSLWYGDEPPEGTGLAVAIASLPPRYRQVILLKYDCGYSNAEIARFLSCTPENVSQSAHREKEKLAESLKEVNAE